MRTFTAFLFSLATTGAQVAAQSSSTTSSAIVEASAVPNNPVGKAYKATLPEEAFFKAAYPEGGNVQGEILASAAPGGAGVVFNVKFSNLPKTGGPFTYHLHVAPVPENGNCTATLAHLDPYERGEAPPCDKSAPETCQVGDLSGKYGSIPEGQDSFTASYTDKYASTLEGIGAFFGNRSFVFHYANKTRISCANFEVFLDADQPSESDCPHSEAPTSTVTASAQPSESDCPQSDEAPTSTGYANITAPASSSLGGVPTTVETAAPSQTSAVIAAGSSIKTGGVSAIALAAAVMFML